MFEQKKDVTDAAFLVQIDQALLQAQAGGVIHGTELEDGDQRNSLPRINTDQKQRKMYLLNPCKSVARFRR